MFLVCCRPRGIEEVYKILAGPRYLPTPSSRRGSAERGQLHLPVASMLKLTLEQLGSRSRRPLSPAVSFERKSRIQASGIRTTKKPANAYLLRASLQRPFFQYMYVPHVFCTCACGARYPWCLADVFVPDAASLANATSCVPTRRSNAIANAIVRMPFSPLPDIAIYRTCLARKRFRVDKTPHLSLDVVPLCRYCTQTCTCLRARDGVQLPILRH